ncbi:hypothetical protein D3C81_1358700 [compost metagenome]
MLLRGKLDRGAADDPVETKVDQRTTQRGGDPDQPVTAIDPLHQVDRFLVDLHYRQHLAVVVVQRNVVLDEEALGRAEQLVFHAPFLDVAVLGGDLRTGLEGCVEVFVAGDPLANQRLVGRPDHHLVRRVDAGQQRVGQAREVFEELRARAQAPVADVLGDVGGVAHDQQVGHLHAGHAVVHQFARRQGLDELAGQQGVTFEAFAYDEARGDESQSGRHRGDDRQADDRKPAQKVERSGRRDGVRLPLQNVLSPYRCHVHEHYSSKAFFLLYSRVPAESPDLPTSATL